MTSGHSQLLGQAAVRSTCTVMRIEDYMLTRDSMQQMEQTWNIGAGDIVLAPQMNRTHSHTLHWEKGYRSTQTTGRALYVVVRNCYSTLDVSRWAKAKIAALSFYPTLSLSAPVRIYSVSYMNRADDADHAQKWMRKRSSTNIKFVCRAIFA